MTCANCEALKAEVSELRRDLGYEADQPLIEALREAFGLTPQGAILLAAIYRGKGKTVRYERLLGALDRTSIASDPARLLSVQLSVMRKAFGREHFTTFKAYGVRVERSGITKIEDQIGRSV